MRFMSRIPQEGDVLQDRFFALHPVTVYGKDATETRWLETVTIEREYVTRCKGPDHWRNVRFVD